MMLGLEFSKCTILCTFFNCYFGTVNHVFILNEEFVGAFYGEDFDDYFYNWKSGEIGLKMFEISGLYQAEISANWLIENKSFEKVG